VISGFRREVDENFTLLGYYAANSGNFLPTFRDKLSVPSSGFKIPNWTCLLLRYQTQNEPFTKHNFCC